MRFDYIHSNACVCVNVKLGWQASVVLVGFWVGLGWLTDWLGLGIFIVFVLIYVRVCWSTHVQECLAYYICVHEFFAVVSFWFDFNHTTFSFFSFVSFFLFHSVFFHTKFINEIYFVCDWSLLLAIVASFLLRRCLRTDAVAILHSSKMCCFFFSVALYADVVVVGFS